MFSIPAVLTPLGVCNQVPARKYPGPNGSFGSAHSHLTVNDDLAHNVNAFDHETFGLATAMMRGSVLQEGCSDDLKCNK